MLLYGHAVVFHNTATHINPWRNFQMKKFTKAMSLAIALVLCVSLMAACTSGKETPDNTTTQAPTQKPEENKPGTTTKPSTDKDQGTTKPDDNKGETKPTETKPAETKPVETQPQASTPTESQPEGTTGK